MVATKKEWVPKEYTENDFKIMQEKSNLGFNAKELAKEYNCELLGIQSFLVKALKVEDQQLIEKLNLGGFDAKNLSKVLELDKELIQTYLDLRKWNHEIDNQCKVVLKERKWNHEIEYQSKVVLKETLEYTSPQPHLTVSPVHYISHKYYENDALKPYDPILYRTTEENCEEGRFVRLNDDKTTCVINLEGDLETNCKIDDVRYDVKQLKDFDLHDPIRYKTPENTWEDGKFFRMNDDNTCDIIKNNKAIGYNWKIDNVCLRKGETNIIKWKTINWEQASLWQKMTVEEALQFANVIQQNLNKWEIVQIDGGRFDGEGYGKHGETINGRKISAIHKGEFTRPSLYGKQIVTKNLRKILREKKEKKEVVDHVVEVVSKSEELFNVKEATKELKEQQEEEENDRLSKREKFYKDIEVAPEELIKTDDPLKKDIPLLGVKTDGSEMAVELIKTDDSLKKDIPLLGVKTDGSEMAVTTQTTSQ